MKVIISVEFFPELESRLPTDVEIIRVDRDGNFDGDASDAEVYFSAGLLQPEVLDRVLNAAPAVRWQHTPSAGVNHLLTPTSLARDLILTNGAGVHAIPIAEFVLALILDRAKDLRKLHERQTEHQWDYRWKDGIFLQELSEATVLIIGAGGIGQAIAERASGFGMRVWGSRKTPAPHPHFEKVVGATEWYDLLPEADFVVLALPLTPETHNIINAEVLRSLKRSAYLINIARGALVDEAALFTALSEGWIAGAGIDAFVTEPLPSDNSLWSAPNLFVTPHISWSSARTRTRSVDLFLDNLQRFRTGQPLRNIVDRHAGY
ncbi:D-2-hydroxyacid dehydrogenase [Tumidithrix elongata RA019]|uniref:D-2-hydroxyacid dehydrogenase n=1 Tax=Tumidithrix elongata BACA0141 TaxID=2716417 RepID=A0AAW9PVP1_9CYAN|nr:D-2-hydroxyacid dehydrogenase [Tumidithrix elongata RA019]